MIRDHFANRTSNPMPQLLLACIVWVIAMICLHDGSHPTWAWCVVAAAALLTLWVGARLLLHLREGGTIIRKAK
jgi:hypothetical protein